MAAYAGVDFSQVVFVSVSTGLARRSNPSYLVVNETMALYLSSPANVNVSTTAARSLRALTASLPLPSDSNKGGATRGRMAFSSAEYVALFTILQLAINVNDVPSRRGQSAGDVIIADLLALNGNATILDAVFGSYFRDHYSLAANISAAMPMSSVFSVLGCSESIGIHSVAEVVAAQPPSISAGTPAPLSAGGAVGVAIAVIVFVAAVMLFVMRRAEGRRTTDANAAAMTGIKLKSVASMGGLSHGSSAGDLNFRGVNPMDRDRRASRRASSSRPGEDQLEHQESSEANAAFRGVSSNPASRRSSRAGVF